MKPLRWLSGLVLLMMLASTAFAQVEVCNNGIDDDFDGFIDCYDSDCSANAACDGIFLGNDALCNAIPPAFPQFTMALDFSSPDETTNHLSRMSIGDLDRDGIPEIVTMNRYTDKVYILKGSDGTVKASASVNFEPYWEVAIANIDNDNCAEIFFIGYQNNSGKSNDGVFIFAYDCNLNFLWRSSNKLPSDPINYGVADFDGDGKIEIYAKDEIFDAHTGTRIIKSTASNYKKINGGPVAVDMVGDSKLELVLGLAIYSVNLGARTADSGSLTLVSSRSEYFIRDEYNATSVADYNQDGFLDVIASGSTIGHDNNTTVFFWDVQNNTLQTYSDPQPGLGSDYTNGWKNGTGRLNIADLDGNGQLNVSYVSGRYLYALDENFNLLWRVNINEETSGYTGCTLFDFNGDGKSEIVYRDERFIYIIDGTNGTVFNQQPCISRTNREYPIVADVDADGSTELCVTCGFNDANAAANFDDLSYSRYSHVRVFKSASEPWVPARRVWNQHGYFVVNVNDDLTIPKTLQKHHLVFSSGSCTQGPNRPLNKFLNQSPFLNSDGCPTYAAPDVAFASAVSITPPQCPNLDFTASFDITNLGDAALSGDLPISFYTNDPTKAGATKLGTITITLNNLTQGAVASVTNAAITGIGSDSLYVVLNDAGTTVPTPIVLPNTAFFECDYDNILGVKIKPLPVTITALEVSPNEICAPTINGSARAFVPTGGGGENTTDYDFYWTDGATANPVGSEDFQGAVYNGIPDGTYTVFARHKTANCGSDTAQVVVSSQPGAVPNITATVTPQTKCDPPDGEIVVSVEGGNSGYTFTWTLGGFPIGVTGSHLTNRDAGTYTVKIEHSVTGCVTSKDINIPGQLQKPDLSASSTGIINCINPNSGTVSSSALVGGVEQPDANYKFDWYFYNNATSTRGSILPPANGAAGTPDRTGLPIGFYEVEVTEISTGCMGTTTQVVEITDQSISPAVDFTELAKQTSCDPTNPNGSLQANVKNGAVTDHTFEWFIGQNTLAANAHTDVSGNNNSIAEKLKGGGQSYTVKVTNTATQCVTVADTIIGEKVVVPVVTLSTTPNSICNDALASANFTGSVTAAVSFDGSPVADLSNYSFAWYDGNLINPPARTETGSSIIQLDSGFYTVVATRNDLGCASIPKTAEVKNMTTLPVVTATADPSTNCDPTMPNGGVQVTDVDGAGIPATYSYQWFRGNTIGGVTIADVAASLDTLQGKAGNFYTALVTNLTNGCQNTATVQVADAHVLPVITLSPTPNGVCNPALTNPPTQLSGQVDATITNQVGAIGDYQFSWSDGNGGLGGNGPSITQLDSGHYTATVTHTVTGCISSPVTTQVLRQTLLPKITASATPSTNCDAALPNGSAQVTDVDGNGANPVNYIFEWYTGNTVVGSPFANTSATNANLQGGPGNFFTVRVTRPDNGCQNTATVEVTTDEQKPVITLSATDNTICAGVPDGSASLATLVDRGVNIPAPFTGYTFAWETGATTSTLSNVAASNYSLKVRNTATGCESDSANIDVFNNLFIPPIDIAATNQTSCDASSPNGSLVATINETGIGGSAGTTAGYNFNWEDNGNPFTTPGVSAGATSAINSLPGNLFYSVTATRVSTGCSNTETIFLSETITTPVVAAAVSSNVTRCDTPNGSIVASVGGTDTGYTFFWLNEVGNNQTADNATVIADADASFTDNGTYNGLIPGYYTVVARDDNTSCISQPITREVKDATIQSTLTITPGPIFPSTCGSADGQMSATVAGGVGPFDMFWHFGGPINDSINFYNNPPQFTPPDDVPFATFVNSSVSNLNNLESRVYTLIVRDQGNGCGNYETIFLPFIDAHTITPVVTPSTICPYTIGNGQIEITVGNITGGNDFQDYTYTFYSGENPDPANQIGPVIGPGAAVTNPEVYSSLAPGFYTIEVRQDLAAFGSNCPVYQVVEVEAHALAPVITLTNTVANTACDLLAAADGSATIEIEKDANDMTTGFTYDIAVNPAPLGWVNPSPTGPYPPASLPETQTITGLSPDNVVPQYSIVVTSSNGCSAEKFVSIPNQPAIGNIANSDVVKQDALYCDPALEVNARAEVTAINVLGGGPDNLSFYQFDWYTDAGLTTNVYSLQGDASATDGGEVFENNVNGVAAGTVTANSYWIVATKNAPGQPGTGCLSAPAKVDIADKSVKPQFTLTPQPNTACDDQYEGSINLKVDNAGSVAAVDYSYNWTIATTAIPPQSNAGGNDTFTNLQDGPYQVEVINNTSGCLSSGQTTIQMSSTPIIVASATKVDQITCDPGGSIQVVDVLVNGAADPNHNNFEFTWFKSDPNSVAILGPSLGVDALNAGNFANIEAGSFYVKAKRAFGISKGSGCESAPLKVDIDDLSKDPVITITTTPNTACDLSVEGALKIVANDPGSLPAALGYSYTWTTTPAGSPIGNTNPNDGDGDGLDGDGDNPMTLGEGDYVLKVENNSTGCTTIAQATILKTETSIIVANANKLDKLICNPDGSITVVDVLVGGVADPDHTHFDFAWFKDDPNSAAIAGATTDVLNNVSFPGITAGAYYVIATRKSGVPLGSGCSSAPLRKDIDDLSVDPGLELEALEPNSSCNLANPNGVVVATASEQDGSTDNYTFVWMLNGGALHPATIQNDASPVSQLTLATEGVYLVTTTNTVTGCSFTQGLTLDLNQSLSQPNIVEVIPTNPVDCNNTGSARVAQITLGLNTTFTNPPDDIDANFNYEWYKGSVPAGILVGETNSSLLNQLPDTYFVLVESLATNCKSALVEVVIDSTNIVFPDVQIAQTSPQISCNAGVGTGTLVATADGQDDTNPNYTFDWYPSLDLSGGSFASSSTITGLSAGDFSVEVKNTITSCTASALFILQEKRDDFMPELSLSSGPLTECDSVDGFVFARAILPAQGNSATTYPFAYNYTADLYVGSPPADINNPEFPNMPPDPNNILMTPGIFLQTNLNVDKYTVRLTDNNTGCVTLDTISVLDGRVFPIPDVNQLGPVTNCDPAKPNGVANVSINGVIAGFTFDWYEGPAVAGAPVFSGVEYSKLKPDPTVYTIEATNLVTGCKGTSQANISVNQVGIPIPTITVISHVTSCVLDNGALAVSVGGNTKDYVFDWYDGTSEKPAPDFVGEIYSDLAVGKYSATATSKITGCKSPLATGEIEARPDYPDFEFAVDAATCEMNDGFATLFLKNNINITSIEWFDQNGSSLVIGPNLMNAVPGTYTVVVTSDMGCATTKQIDINTDIHPFNGISRNGDGMNDYFHIDCIDQFPDNIVKIFNRAGTLVYEAHGYENIDIRFDGKSNKGISPMGTNLPDGTYFYIVDKMDGSKPIAGYLEIVN